MFAWGPPFQIAPPAPMGGVLELSTELPENVLLVTSSVPAL